MWHFLSWYLYFWYCIFRSCCTTTVDWISFLRLALSMQTILCYSSVLRSFTGLYFFYWFVHCNLFRTNSTVRPGRYGMSGLLWGMLRWHQNCFYSLWKPTTTLHFTCNVKELKLGISLWLLTIFLISSVSVGLKIEPQLCFIQQNWWFLWRSCHFLTPGLTIRRQFAVQGFFMFFYEKRTQYYLMKLG